uniref:BTB domain-containing protein n=1 Tax=Heterorhabditis bacteriophora TaxID=37862 RepID=A0A1I7WYN1_HETBA
MRSSPSQSDLLVQVRDPTLKDLDQIRSLYKSVPNVSTLANNECPHRQNNSSQRFIDEFETDMCSTRSPTDSGYQSTPRHITEENPYMLDDENDIANTLNYFILQSLLDRFIHIFQLTFPLEVFSSCVKAGSQALAMFALSGTGGLKKSLSQRAEWLVDKMPFKPISDTVPVYLTAALECSLEELIRKIVDDRTDIMTLFMFNEQIAQHKDMASFFESKDEYSGEKYFFNILAARLLLGAECAPPSTLFWRHEVSKDCSFEDACKNFAFSLIATGSTENIRHATSLLNEKLNSSNQFGLCLLSEAVLQENEDVLRTLIAAGCPMNLTLPRSMGDKRPFLLSEFTGWTPLTWLYIIFLFHLIINLVIIITIIVLVMNFQIAVQQCNSAMTLKLLDNGADPFRTSVVYDSAQASFRNTGCPSALALACTRGNLHLMTLVIERLSAMNSPSTVNDFLSNSRKKNESDNKTDFQRLPIHTRLALQEAMYYAVETSRPEMACNLKKCDLISMKIIELSTSLQSPQPPPHRSLIDSSFVNNEHLSDVRFMVDGEIVFGHRIVLFNASDRFRKLLQSPNGVVNITDVSHKIFISLMEFLYTGRLPPLDVLSLFSLIAASDLYCLPLLRTEIITSLSSLLSSSNVGQLYQFAIVHTSRKLLSDCERFVLEHFGSLVSHPRIRELIVSSSQDYDVCSALSNVKTSSINDVLDLPKESLSVLLMGDTQYHYKCEPTNIGCKQISKRCRESYGLDYYLRAAPFSNETVKVGQKICIKLESRYANRVQRQRDCERVKAVTRLISKMRYPPSALIIDGDLTDFGHNDEHKEFQAGWMKSFPVPILAGLGNHDYENNINDCAFNFCAHTMLTWYVHYMKQKIYIKTSLESISPLILRLCDMTLNRFRFTNYGKNMSLDLDYRRNVKSAFDIAYSGSFAYSTRLCSVTGALAGD